MMAESEERNKFKKLAGQLHCPSGDDGIKTADQMAQSNSNMISQTIQSLKIGPDDIILEIGPGNGSHLPEILSLNGTVRYNGVDISSTMVNEAIKLNQLPIQQGRADFGLSDGDFLNFKDAIFTKVFSVNTLYFWQHPVAYAREILRVLISGGHLYLTFASRDFMEKLPFTAYNFKLYHVSEVSDILKSAGFELGNLSSFTEKIRSNAGMDVEREFYILEAKKPE
ncbi:class I SAM-dependent methyltransferase [Pedobacter antarcticus]|nr:class I SAM-dependent methyltransferase [Pedobacter antarcticus]